MPATLNKANSNVPWCCAVDDARRRVTTACCSTTSSDSSRALESGFMEPVRRSSEVMGPGSNQGLTATVHQSWMRSPTGQRPLERGHHERSLPLTLPTPMPAWARSRRLAGVVFCAVGLPGEPDFLAGLSHGFGRPQRRLAGTAHQHPRRLYTHRPGPRSALLAAGRRTLSGSARRGGIERDRRRADQAQLHPLAGKGGVEHPVHGGVEPVAGHRQQVVSAGDSLGRSS